MNVKFKKKPFLFSPLHWQPTDMVVSEWVLPAFAPLIHDDATRWEGKEMCERRLKQAFLSESFSGKVDSKHSIEMVDCVSGEIRTKSSKEK